MNKPLVKTTEFDGFISGDYECFCLCKIPFKNWCKLSHTRSEDEELLLYPDDFFPIKRDDKKYHFKITVEVTPFSLVNHQSKEKKPQ